jgi:hypothetical protein
MVSSECHPIPQFTTAQWDGVTCKYTARPSQVTLFLVPTTTTTTTTTTMTSSSSAAVAAVLLHQVKLDPLFFIYREEGSSSSSSSSGGGGGGLVIPRDVNLSFTTTTMTVRLALPKVVFGIYPCPGVVLEQYILGQKRSSLPLDFSNSNNDSNSMNASPSSSSLLHHHDKHQKGIRQQYTVRGQLMGTKGEYVQLTVQAVTNGGSSLRSAASPCALLEITLSASSVAALLKLHSSIIERIQALSQQVGETMASYSGGGRGGDGMGKNKKKGAAKELDAAQLLYSSSSSSHHHHNVISSTRGDVIALEAMLDEVKTLQARVRTMSGGGGDTSLEMMRLRKLLSKIPFTIHV